MNNQPLYTDYYIYSSEIKDRLISIKRNLTQEIYEVKYEGDNAFTPSSIVVNGQTQDLIWEGRRLKKLGQYSYLYNENGIRISKKTGTYGFDYIIEGNLILRAINKTASKTVIIDYHYDEKNQVCGLNYNGEEYFYIRDLIGNINSIVDKKGTVIVQYSYTAFGVPSKAIGMKLTIEEQNVAQILLEQNIFLYKGYCYDVETGLYYCNSRYYNPEWGRWLNADDVSYLDPESIGGLNLYAYCGNNPVMYTDPTGKFAISLTVLGLIIGAVVGATAGGIVAYNIAKDNGAEGWELFGWTMAGIVGGGIIGGALGAGAGALVTKATGITGLSITKYSIVPIKGTTVLGHMPGYIGAAQATGSGYYLISDGKYNQLVEKGLEWGNNLTYLKDANRLGSIFVLAPDYIVRTGGTFWKEIQYLIEHGIPWELF